VIIPIGHEQPLTRWPYVTVGIIVACTLVQLYAQFVTVDAHALQAAIDANDVARAEQLLDKFPIWRWGYHTDGSGSAANLVLSAFVHGGWLHLIGNMVFLFIAGTAVEDELGPVKFLAFYLVGAVASTLGFSAMYHGQPTILVGASGAISAVMGAFLFYFAGTRIQFAYWFMMRGGTFFTPAYVALPLWLGEQFMWRALQGPTEVSGVAYEAHIGGFLAGFLLAFVLRRVFRTATSRGDAAAPIPPARAIAPRGAAAGPPARARAAHPTSAPEAVEERYDRLIVAMRELEMDDVARLASRVILDLSRLGEDERIVDVYEGMARLPKRPLTDGAYAAAARAAEARGRVRLRDEILEAMKEAHPGSALLRKH
jgi:membrane associated rhomboid family serine protease